MTDPLKIHAGRPEPPKHLTGEARRLWRKLAPQLADGGTLAPAVGTTLEVACQAYADWRLHTARVAKEGAIVKSPAGFAQAHPSVAMAAKAAETWRKFSKLLGVDKRQRAREPDLPAYLRRKEG